MELETCPPGPAVVQGVQLSRARIHLMRSLYSKTVFSVLFSAKLADLCHRTSEYDAMALLLIQIKLKWAQPEWISVTSLKKQTNKSWQLC